ncbi:MAG: YeeE/YedE family protein [Pseudomonadota bacterium]|nr:YeeE/YedE family protein [Pseudomonadota bacterium]
MNRSQLSAFGVGLLFGLGLLLAGMANPAKVLAFLDLAGPWDPSLALVMVGAIAVASIGFTLTRGRSLAWSGEPIQIPTNRKLDRRLVLGSLGFGVGWGLAGFCPGPALVALGTGSLKAVIFVAAMLAGMALFERLERG